MQLLSHGVDAPALGEGVNVERSETRVVDIPPASTSWALRHRLNQLFTRATSIHLAPERPGGLAEMLDGLGLQFTERDSPKHPSCDRGTIDSEVPFPIPVGGSLAVPWTHLGRLRGSAHLEPGRSAGGRHRN